MSPKFDGEPALTDSNMAPQLDQFDSTEAILLMYLMPMGIVGGVYLLIRKISTVGRSTAAAPAGEPQRSATQPAEASKSH